MLRSRSEDIGQSSVNTLSSTLNYNLGVYNNQMRNGGNNTSSYLSLNNVTALREHHVVLDGSLYGIGSGNQDSDVYKAMYERDFAGHRFAGGMLDTWNLQSLGPMTAVSAGKIYGASWGNQASSTVFDNTQSATPVVAFLPAAGEVHLTRDGRLMSVQNFAMGNHEVDTRGLPYGIYDVDVEVIVNGTGWSANAPSGSINCSAADAAPARRWPGNSGAAASIWIAGPKAVKKRFRQKIAGWRGPRPPGRSVP